MKTRIRVGIVGGGFGAAVLVPAFRSVPGVEVAAIALSRSDRAKAIATALKISRFYGNWESLVKDKDLDAVAIAVPPALQPKIARAALQNRKAVFCEKPLALDVRSAELLLQEARRRKLAHMIDFEFAETPAFLEARKRLRSGALGALRHVSVDWKVEIHAYRKGLSDSWKVWSGKGGGVLPQFASHAFYHIEWLAGEPLTRLTARLARSSGLPGDAASRLNLWGEMKTGATMECSIATDAAEASTHRLSFYGTEGVLVLENTGKDYMNGFRWELRTRKKTFKSSPVQEDGRDGRIGAAARVAQKFVNWVRSKEPARPDWSDALRVQRLMDAAVRSNRKRSAWVDCR